MWGLCVIMGKFSQNYEFGPNFSSLHNHARRWGFEPRRRRHRHHHVMAGPLLEPPHCLRPRHALNRAPRRQTRVSNCCAVEPGPEPCGGSCGSMRGLGERGRVEPAFKRPKPARICSPRSIPTRIQSRKSDFV